MKKEERVGRLILQRIAANGEDERREGRGRNGGGGGGAREVGVGGIKICIDASQIYRGMGFLSVLALSPMVS